MHLNKWRFSFRLLYAINIMVRDDEEKFSDGLGGKVV